jgi:hypothetical protein
MTNLVTEEEAWSKKCCNSVGSDVGFCIASRCMAWRWGSKRYLDWNEDTKRYGRSEEQGSCGLAGSVEQ